MKFIFLDEWNDRKMKGETGRKNFQYENVEIMLCGSYAATIYIHICYENKKKKKENEREREKIK